MRTALIPVASIVALLLLASAAGVQAESYLGSGASDSQVRKALLNTRSLSRPKPVTEAAAAGASAGSRQSRPAAGRAGQSAANKPARRAATAGAGGAAVAGAAAAADDEQASGDEAAGPASFEIFFDLNSAALRKDSLPVLDRLGAALGAPELKDFRFVVEGHTDATGSEPTNLALSENRAKSVRDYLVEKHQIDPARLEPKGLGASDLYDPQNPRSAKNRRVRFVNPDAAP